MHCIKDVTATFLGKRINGKVIQTDKRKWRPATTQKNGATPKSQMNRKNKIK